MAPWPSVLGNLEGEIGFGIFRNTVGLRPGGLNERCPSALVSYLFKRSNAPSPTKIQRPEACASGRGSFRQWDRLLQLGAVEPFRLIGRRRILELNHAQRVGGDGIQIHPIYYIG